MVEDGGVELHPISENLVFKASRRTIPAALSSMIVGTQGRTRTDTILLLRETPHTNWATWAKEKLQRNDYVLEVGAILFGGRCRI